MRTDMHFHSRLSDGGKENHEILERAKAAGLEFASCTDHDLVNLEFARLAKAAGIMTCEAVEISATDSRSGEHLHLTCYAREFKRSDPNGQDVFSMLESSRTKKQEKVWMQVDLLRRNGFEASRESFLQYLRERGINTDNLNSYHLSAYVYDTESNIAHLHSLTGERMTRPRFLAECLKEEGRFHHIGSVTLPEYEPPLEVCGSIASRSDAILSLAHPNFKMSLDEFKTRIGHYTDCGINGVEINAKATKQWVDAIVGLQSEYGYFITFGSDSHMSEKEDAEHADLGAANPNVSPAFIREQMRRNIERLCNPVSPRSQNAQARKPLLDSSLFKLPCMSA